MTADVARFDHLRRGGDVRRIELVESVDVSEDVRELRTICARLLVGQSKTSELRYVTDVEFGTGHERLDFLGSRFRTYRRTQTELTQALHAARLREKVVWLHAFKSVAGRSQVRQVAS